jgi:uncharacterized protein (TIGR04168 family)
VSTTLYVIGDVHGFWDEADQAFLESQPEATAVFVGDFGEEDVALVERIAAVRSPKAIHFGNHDAWYAMRGRGTRERVMRQLALAGEDFLGYRALLAAGGEVALVGARPFSWGGPWLDRRFYEEMFDVRSHETSASRIVAAAESVAAEIPLVLVGHNGPRGVGGGPDALWGRDFELPAVDWGDPDQEQALARLRAAGRQVVACIGGHMHEALRGAFGLRRRLAEIDGTTFINAAVVPRHKRGLRHFVRVRIAEGVTAADIWVSEEGDVVQEAVLNDER